ncbi:MAG TPA: metallophosphoesterase family protein, partial [Armatimonadota bacterium]|nr:metallophosphoesterase family protein [Armatimonadota bacterium]
MKSAVLVLVVLLGAGVLAGQAFPNTITYGPYAVHVDRAPADQPINRPAVGAGYVVDAPQMVTSDVCAFPNRSTRTSRLVTWTSSHGTPSNIVYYRILGAQTWLTGSDPTIGTGHSVTLAGLTPDSLYEYYASSGALDMVPGTSAVKRFDTCAVSQNQFVITADLHPYQYLHWMPPIPIAYDQVTRLQNEVLALHPGFVICAGDVGGDMIPGGTEEEIRILDEAFKKWRQAGTEIYIAVGNHDVPSTKPDVTQIKMDWFCSQVPPYPMNSMLDASVNPDVYDRFYNHGQRWYSFNWRNIHFVIMDSNDVVAGDISSAQRQWLVNDLCFHTNNPWHFPTLVFVHNPDWMTGEHGSTIRPLYNILAQYPSKHTVKAVFGGHHHCGTNYPPENNLGIQVYTVPYTVHPIDYAECTMEYVVATVGESAITFLKKVVAVGAKSPRQVSDMVYYPIPWSSTVPCITVDEARKAADGHPVILSNAVVSANFYGDAGGGGFGRTGFAVEAGDRSNGIRVVSNAAVSPGYSMTVEGTAATVDGERVINATSVAVNSTGNSTPLPFVCQTLDTGGGTYGGQGAVVNDATQSPAMMCRGLNNVGILMRIQGEVRASVFDSTYGNSYFYVDDGYGVHNDVWNYEAGVKDGSGNIGVRCRPASTGSGSPGALPAVGDYVDVTGVIGVKQVYGCNARYIWTTSWTPATFQSYSYDYREKWNLLSLPGQPKDPDPAAVFGGSGVVDCRLYRWDAPYQGLLMYGTSSPDLFGAMTNSEG